MSLAYATSYDTTSGKYKVTSATVSGINVACNGLTLGVTLTNSSNAVLSTGSATVAGTSQAVSFGTSADADLVAGTAVVIS